MHLQHIRHSTVKINVNQFTFLVDPMFSSKGELEPVANAANTLKNPLVDLPIPIEGILNNVDAIFLTHSHRDHFDDRAISEVPKSTPIFCQPEDRLKLLELGFKNVVQVNDQIEWNEVNIIRTGGQHGTGELAKQMGPVSGFILKAVGEPSLYVAGDTVWCDEVFNAIKTYSPNVIILNGGEARYLTGDPITMGNKDIELVSMAAPNSEIVVVHMEAWNHCLLSRAEINNNLITNGIENVKVPLNGEILNYDLKLKY